MRTAQVRVKVRTRFFSKHCPDVQLEAMSACTHSRCVSSSSRHTDGDILILWKRPPEVATTFPPILPLFSLVGTRTRARVDRPKSICGQVLVC